MKKDTILITGASRGIGKAIAEAFAKKGNCHLFITCKSSDHLLKQVKNELEQKYNVTVTTFCGDMGNYDTVSELFGIIGSFQDSLDILINNAGISHIGLLSDMSPAEWNSIMQTNVTSVFNCCHHAIPSMVRQKSGRIINISSVWGISGASCEVAYSTSKGAVNTFTKALAKELAPSNIQVNAIACGAIDTEMNHFLSCEDRLALCEDIPAGRFGLPEEVGLLAVQLGASPSYLSGQIISLDGSWQ